MELPKYPKYLGLIRIDGEPLKWRLSSFLIRFLTAMLVFAAKRRSLQFPYKSQNRIVSVMVILRQLRQCKLLP